MNGSKNSSLSLVDNLVMELNCDESRRFHDSCSRIWLAARFTVEELRLFHLLDDHFQSPSFHRLGEDLVVAFALVRIGDGEVGDGSVEFVALA